MLTLITPKITNLGYSNLWSDMSTILGYASNFNQQIQKLFANNEQGFWYDPNDLSTMFQDTEGTVPVTAVGQPVGLIRDKSGRNNHAFQTNSESRPILRQNSVTGANYLEFDGVDDFLQTNNIDFTATDKMSLFAVVQKLRSSPVEAILELGVLPYNGVGTFWISSNALAPNDVWIAIAQSWDARTGFSKIAPVANNFIVSAKLDFAGSVATDEVKPRLNGSTEGLTRGLGAHAGTGNFGIHPLHIGSRAGASLPFNGHIYSLISVGKLVSDDEIVDIEKELAKRVGVTLNV